MIEAFAISALVAADLAVGFRLVGGPTLYDRALAALSINIKLALVVAAGAVALGRPELIDQAIIQIVLGHVLAIAVLKALRFRSLQPTLDARPGGEGGP